MNVDLRASEWRQACAHLSSHDGFEGDAADEVGPDDVQHLQHQQQKVKEPPGRVRPDDVPALEERRVQNPATTKHCISSKNHVTSICAFYQ